MTDTHHPQGPGGTEAERHPEHSAEELDHDLDLKAIVWTGVGVAGMTIVSALLMMVMMRLFSHADARSGATLTERPAAPAAAPPQPALQESERVDMETLRTREELDLQHASWVDPKQGTVRLPLEVAIDVIAAQGLPRTPATGASTSIDRGPTNQVSPGTVLPAPGQGVGQLGPSAAAPGSLSGATPSATDLPGQTRPPLLATPATAVPYPATRPAAAPPVAPTAAPSSTPPPPAAARPPAAPTQPARPPAAPARPPRGAS